MEICAVGDELSHAEGPTDMVKLVVAFHNLLNTPRKN